MKKLSPLLWLLVVIVISAFALSKIERFQEDRQISREPHDPGSSAEVLLVGYAGEEFPGSDDTSSFEVIECDDVLVPVTIPASSSRLASVLTALSLYDPKDGLHNPLHDKEITIQSVAEDEDGVLRINLTGEPIFGKLCDLPRFRSQLQETIALHTTQRYVLLLNGSERDYRCLGEGVTCR